CSPSVPCQEAYFRIPSLRVSPLAQSNSSLRVSPLAQSNSSLRVSPLTQSNSSLQVSPLTQSNSSLWLTCPSVQFLYLTHRRHNTEPPFNCINYTMRPHVSAVNPHRTAPPTPR
uniref:Uncharacterized protein n=1 Tax=Paramormyrops kingsleyae TaxID=1676925 RepID=A0A3B3R0N6_9TELE